MLIKNANVFLPDHSFSRCDVAASDVIECVGTVTGAADIDAEGCFLIPGLIDIHTHGAVGHDASDGSPEGLAEMSRFYAANGVTSFCATTMTLPYDTLRSAMDSMRRYVRPPNGARCLGVNLEGPFLSYAKRGAQNGEYLRKPDIKMFDSLNEASDGNIRLCGIAPELEGIGEDPTGTPNNLMPNISQTAIGKFSELNIFGGDYPTCDGTGVRDYIHVVDLACGHVAAIKYVQNFCGAEAFNLGTGKGYSVMEIVRAFETVAGVRVPYRISARRAGDIAICYADPTKAREKLGWKAEKDIMEMCADTWRWQTQNSNGYQKLN